MRFAQDKVFQPFSLLIETEAEANLLATLLGSTTEEIAEAVAPGVNSEQMYELLANNGHKGMFGVEIQLNGGIISPVTY